MSLLYVACVPSIQAVRNPRLVATAVFPSIFARKAQVITVSDRLCYSIDIEEAEHRGVLGAWVTPHLFIPPRALFDYHHDALAILECESAGR